ncbi:hypothetical protein OGATHE_002111 [Ogataea polymorpha]|uniref:Uncharacterized protein n=1 Tax=Ogataea polymorpha TaxID=460523 RepID=A0A9P8TCJ0_9ASCO|nr:hypothetical protein OGATHE_002111 [Ogataea polymorpha]
MRSKLTPTDSFSPTDKRLSSGFRVAGSFLFFAWFLFAKDFTLLTRLTITGTQDADKALSVLEVTACIETTCFFTESRHLMYSVAILTDGAWRHNDVGLWFGSVAGLMIMIEAPLNAKIQPISLKFECIEEKSVGEPSAVSECAIS